MSDGCYICRPDDPDAPEDGCRDCEAEFWAWVAEVEGAE